ncbi:endothelin-converting enzyme 1-like isoform X1 [Amblyomma americanum]
MPTPESKKPEDGAPSLSVVIEGEDLQKNVPTDAGLAPQPSGAPQQKTPRKTAGKRRRKGRGASQTQNKAMPATQSAEVASAPAAASVDAIQTAEPSREEAGGSLSASAFPAESCPGASPQADAGAPKLEPVSDAAATGSTPGATMSTPAAADKPRSPLAKKGHSVMAMNALLEDHCSPTSTTKPSRGASFQGADGRRHSQSRGVVTGAVLLGAVLLAFLLFLKPKSPHHIMAYCQTDSCYAFRKLLHTQLNKSIEACDDFGAYVCDQWRPQELFARLSDSVLSDMASSWRQIFQAVLERGTSVLPAGRKVAAMFNSCLTQSEVHVDVLKEFMRARGLLWWEYSGRNPPLQILFDLSFNWNVDLWFAVRLLPNTAQGPQRRLSITRSPLIPIWNRVFNLIPRDKFATVYIAMFELLLGNSSLPTHKQAMSVYISQGAILRRLLESTRSSQSPAFFPLMDVAKHSSLATPKYMENIINRALQLHPPFKQDDLLVLSDSTLLDAVLTAIRDFGDYAVLQHFTWFFMQTYAALAGPRDFLRAVHGSSEKAEEVWPRYCAVHTEGSYKLMAAALSAVALFTADERRRIDTYLKVVQQAAAKRTQAAQWLDEETKKVAAEKLLSARTFLWPSKKYLTNEGVEEAYKDFPENGTSFVRLWIDSRQSGRRTVGSEAYFEEQQLTSSMSLPYAEYVHMLNAVELAVGAMRPPLYYPRGTKAMLHGGLGYFFARQLTRAVDDEGVKVDPHGRILSSWVSEASGPAFDKRLRGCLAENESVFPEVPALEVAYAAFREDVNPTQELLSPELSEEQVFFIAACSTSCSKSSAGNAFTGQCNKAVMNFAPFAQAFGCAPGSRMNPEKKCSFFD